MEISHSNKLGQSLAEVSMQQLCSHLLVITMCLDAGYYALRALPYF